MSYRDVPLTVPTLPPASRPPTVFLMRGLPSSGKSHTAKLIAGDTGTILETDQYFYTEVGDDPQSYDYQADLLETARAWNFERFAKAIAEQHPTIIVDRGNGLNPETREYAEYALRHGYEVQLQEPISAWWLEIRVLLKYQPLTDPALDDWAEELARRSQSTHRVSSRVIRRWMRGWRVDLTVEQILRAVPDED